jgi:hypothetical protein
MNNYELMEILGQLHKTKKNKDLAIILGTVAVAALAYAIYCHKMNKSTTNDFLLLHAKHQSLLTDEQKNMHTIRKQQGQIQRQSEFINELTVKKTPPEMEEKKA